MREIKFRAIPLFGESFVFGSLIIEPNERGEDTYIIRRYENGRVCYFEVKKETIGQYTGLKIKDIEVYEGDIIKARKDYCYKVVFENGSFVLYHTNKYAGKENIRWGLLGRFFDVDMKDILKECKVISNIYENPELLKGEI